VRALGIALTALALCIGSAEAQQRIPGTNVPAVSCGPSNSSPACEALRQALPGGSLPGLITPRLTTPPPPVALPRPDMDDVRARRLVPPSIVRMLNDRRVDPNTRAYLIGMAGKPNDEWTLADLQTLSILVPTLTEVNITEAALKDFYQFLGLDPTDLFNPQIGGNWQVSSTLGDRRNFAKVSFACIDLQRTAQRDPSTVKVEDLLACNPSR
jgi:hypothetical protein